MANFDPATFGLLARTMASGAPSGGLLDFLRDPSLLAAMPQGGQAAWPNTPGMKQPEPAVMPANAQPTQGVGNPLQIAPQAAAMPQQQPESPNHFMTGLQGFLGNLHNGPIGAIAGGLGGLVTGQRTDPGGIAQQQANMTAQALMKGGLDQATAMAVARNPDLLKAVLPEVLGFGGKTEDIKEYNLAKKDPEFAKYMAGKRSTTGEYGLNYVYGTENGKTVAFAPGKNGVPKRVEFPAGFDLASGIEKVDATTHWVIKDKRTGQTLGTEPKNLQAGESAQERGKIQGQAQGELPAAELAAKRSVSKIQEFLDDKGFNEVFGMLDQYRPNITMSDDGRRALTRYNQMEGTAFLEGRSMLKGGGAITDFESKKAEAAFSRLSRSLSEDDARAALKDFKEAVEAGLEKLRAKARGDNAPAAAPTATTRIRLNADGSIAQ